MFNLDITPFSLWKQLEHPISGPKIAGFCYKKRKMLKTHIVE
jgi:hypothetical protein